MVTIEFIDTLTAEDSIAIVSLAETINDETPIVAQTSMEVKDGTKGDLTFAIGIVTLGLTAISSLIAVLDYWRSRYPKYSISLKIGNTTYKKEGMDKKEFESILRLAIEQKTDVKIPISLQSSRLSNGN